MPGIPAGRPWWRLNSLIHNKWLKQILVFLVLAGLLFFAYSRAPLPEIWNALRLLRLWQIALLVIANTLIYLLVSARWWLIVHAENRRIRYFPLIGVRVSVFGISYFTFGPQVGGEPLQVLYLQRRYGLTYTRATAGVLMDKLLEFLANFVLLSLGLTAIFEAGLLSMGSGLPLAGLAGLLCLVSWPILHIILLYNRHYPVSALLLRLPVPGRTSRVFRFIRASEHLAGQFCRRHPGSLLAAILASLLASAGTVIEYALITSFLHVGLPFWQTVSAWTAGWLSFLVPLPGGLGALEASQVFALGVFGVPAATAISVTLLMRARDLAIGGLGLILAGTSTRRF